MAAIWKISVEALLVEDAAGSNIKLVAKSPLPLNNIGSNIKSVHQSQMRIKIQICPTSNKETKQNLSPQTRFQIPIQHEQLSKEEQDNSVIEMIAQPSIDKYGSH